jgi:dihydroorotate dehydrogenase electron transfer subunit
VERGVRVYAVSSARTTDALVGGDFYRERGVQHVLAVTDADGSSSVDRLGARLVADLRTAPVEQVFVCRSRRLVSLATDLAARCGAEVQVSLEAHMACGLGYCHGCASGAPGFADESPLICADGPVFACLPA